MKVEITVYSPSYFIELFPLCDEDIVVKNYPTRVTLVFIKATKHFHPQPLHAGSINLMSVFLHSDYLDTNELQHVLTLFHKYFWVE